VTHLQGMKITDKKQCHNGSRQRSKSESVLAGQHHDVDWPLACRQPACCMLHETDGADCQLFIYAANRRFATMALWHDMTIFRPKKQTAGLGWELHCSMWTAGYVSTETTTTFNCILTAMEQRPYHSADRPKK